jgi:hypothetical protein
MLLGGYYLKDLKVCQSHTVGGGKNLKILNHIFWWSIIKGLFLILSFDNTVLKFKSIQYFFMMAQKFRKITPNYIRLSRNSNLIDILSIIITI